MFLFLKPFEWGLIFILLLVFILPLSSKKIEHNLELFLFVMGILALTISKLWSKELVHEALMEPIPITVTVFLAGLAFKWGRKKLETGVSYILTIIPAGLFVFFLIVLLGLVSSAITAIIASLILVEFVLLLKIPRQQMVQITVIACFSIGLGAALTPIGEPLSTIVVSKMDADFWYLLRNFSYLIIPLVSALGLFAVWFHKKRSTKEEKVSWKNEDSAKEVLIRALKVYFFVMALIFLGGGFKPLIDTYLITLSSGVLFWINMISAILDNATLAAAEISPSLSAEQMKSILMALLISGGMLIPGNIPNIIAANKLKITSREWAKVGVPLGLLMMIVYFCILEVF
ncbi:MAG: DUF1646 family protein [Deltaproteobacteria bacterium]